ncbi:MAG: glycoside hydrolase family 3 protein [Treponema sp.]|uniref:glycoside hydrolase family 3 protein n=1 Tax=Treponema sp. TaxID=166 RepID=UPI001B45DC76|nr:glycoside hydrolase family 3 protein [Treponema sp.]MBP3773214.1 glycoside hydrolase family 3 protein [Treponema sp.]MBQ9282464.1 glycoside hydrolase family 3 protein [Treponema sp.]
MKKFSALFLSIFVLFGSYTQNSLSIPDNADFWSDYPAEALADFLISKMSDEEKLAQMYMFGWAGKEPSLLLNQWVSDRGLGSVKVFGWNTDDTELVAKSIASLQERAQRRHLRIPLFVATDQEGGWIRHVKGDTSETPGNMAIGASQYPIDSYYSAYYISREIKALGINMNFAPTIDLYTNHDSSVISSRSFGEDPEFVGQLGSAFVAGSLAAGVIPTAKHFAGHGDTSSDSHVNLPEVYIDYETAESRELVPFKYLISQNVPAIMSGHLLFPRIDKSPSSLSKVWLTDILREKLHYNGLIITDDMMMEGAWGFAGNSSRAFEMAIQAGNDIILSSRTAELDEKLWTLNLSNIRTDPEFRKIVESAARRVILAKLVYFKSGNAAPLYPEIARLSEQIPDRDGQKFFLSQACRAITLFKRGAFPYKRGEGEQLLVIGPSDSFPDEKNPSLHVESDFFTEAKARYGEFAFYKINFDALGAVGIDWNGNQLEAMASNYETIIFYVPNKEGAQIARRLSKCGKRVIIMSVLTPVPVLTGFEFADTILFGYSYSPYTFKALFAALAGDFEPEGKVPLNLK